MSESTRWPVGTTIVLQEVWQGRLLSARPTILVQDTRDMIVLWCPKGTPWKTGTTPPTRERAPTRAERIARSLALCDWILVDFTWPVSDLFLMRPGDWHAIWVGWDDAVESFGWYVNLQRPFVRKERALQTMDLMLDIVVDPDHTWRWKDEDELEALVSARLIEQEELAQIWEEARRMIVKIEANKPPFSEPWHDWRPDQSWGIPELPEGWDSL